MGWRRHAYSPPCVNSGGRYSRRRRFRYACFTPRKSAWSTANMDHTSEDQPAPYTAQMAAEPGLVEVPEHRAHRLPPPEEGQQQQARDQHEGAALRRRRDEPRGAPLEAGAGHHRVLHGEGQQQGRVDPERRPGGSGDRCVDTAGRAPTGEESDRPGGADDEGGVGDHGVPEDDQTGHRAGCGILMPSIVATADDEGRRGNTSVRAGGRHVPGGDLRPRPEAHPMTGSVRREPRRIVPRCPGAGRSPGSCTPQR